MKKCNRVHTVLQSEHDYSKNGALCPPRVGLSQSTQSSIFPDLSLPCYSSSTSQRLSLPCGNMAVHQIPGDGNCFFHALSYATSGNFQHSSELRQKICGAILSRWMDFQGIIQISHSPDENQDSYAQKMLHGNGWATNVEIQVASDLLSCNINVWLRNAFQNKTTGCHEIRYNLSSYCGSGQVSDERNVELLLENNHFSVLSPAESVVTSSPLSAFITSRVLRQHSEVGKRKCDIDDTLVKNKSIKFLHASASSKVALSRKLGFQIDEEVNKEKLTDAHIHRQINFLQRKYKVNVEDLPDAPPSVDPKFDKAMDAIRTFELEQMSYSVETCSICLECRLSEVHFSGMCARCKRDKIPIKMFSAENCMDPGQVPSELADLTVVEQQLIARISPCINVHMLRHGGMASSGHCITFPQEVNEPARIFPKLPTEIKIIRVRKQGKNDSSKDFRVRRRMVESALKWLKANNPAFSDIEISIQRLNRLPVDGQLDDLETVEFPPDTVHLDDKGPAEDQFGPAIIGRESASGVLIAEPPVNIEEEVRSAVNEVIGDRSTEVTFTKRGIVTIPWPTRDGTPLSEFTTRHFFTMAFPCLFPHGRGDFFMNRLRTCESLANWCEHLLWYRDGRFARHPYFKFIVHNMILRRQTLEKTSYIVRQQLGEEHLTVADLRQRLEKGDDSVLRKILYFGRTLRGSAQYWSQRSCELISLMNYQINEGNGLPSMFTTGSCAEYYFKPLRQLLGRYIKETQGKEIDFDCPSNMYSALQENTHVVGHYFDMRTRSYFERVMKPVFDVDAYWYRMEFAKSRGMIHWHGLCWRRDREPHNMLYDAINLGLTDDEAAAKLSEWAKLNFAMTASHPAGNDANGLPRKNLWPAPEGSAPPPPEEKNPLVKLLMDVSESQATLLEDHLLLSNRFNLHRCSDYCLRPPRGKANPNSEKVCRMEFGTSENPGKILRSTPAIVKDRNGRPRLAMVRDHPMLVQHSKYHTQAWRANGDISLIIGTSDPANPSVDDIIGMEKYVCGYACKGNEPTGATIDLFSDIVSSSDSTSAMSLCSKLLMETVKRDVSAVEASYELSSLPLYRCSHSFQHISMTGSRQLEKNGTTLTKKTPLDRYIDRPEDKQCSWYEYICETGKVPVVAGSFRRATWPLNEEYCRTSILLHWPNWRSIGDIKSPETSWVSKMEEFLSLPTCPNFIIADVEQAQRKAQNPVVPEENLDELSDLEDELERPEWMDVLRPNGALDGQSDDFDYDDGGPDFDWSDQSHSYPTDLGMTWLMKLNDTSDTVDSDVRIPDVDIASLNENQSIVFGMVMETLLKYKSAEQFEPIRLIVGGTAGSGKSYLIKCLVKAIRTVFQSQTAVQVVCPTGNSANLISGVTLHSFLKVPTNRRNREMIPPVGSLGDALQKNCDGLIALLVDERSLIGATTLGWMEFMCRCGVTRGQESSSLWGGLPVVVFLGDDVQLPPVCDSPVYFCRNPSPAAMHGAMVWKTFDQAVILTTSIRQSDDEPMFRNVLSSLREYKCSDDQAKWLQKFQWDDLKNDYGTSLIERMSTSGIFVFPTHALEWEHNRQKLLDANKSNPIARITAYTKGLHAKSTSIEQSCGLVRTLYLCRGAKVMLSCNINVPHGLFNGSMGTVIDIIYSDGERPNDSIFPDVVVVEFPLYTGPPFVKGHPKVVPIVPVDRNLDCSCHGCKCRQIPLRLGWGTTIHRCQGMTVGHNEPNRYIVIHPGSRAFEARNPGALFVALSRAKSAGGIQRDPDFAWHPNVMVNVDRLCMAVNTATSKARASEMKRINAIAQSTRQKQHHLLKAGFVTDFTARMFGSEE